MIIAATPGHTSSAPPARSASLVPALILTLRKPGITAPTPPPASANKMRRIPNCCSVRVSALNASQSTMAKATQPNTNAKLIFYSWSTGVARKALI